MIKCASQGITDSKVRSIKSILNFTIDSFPFIYLGVLISPYRLKASFFKPIVEKISRTCSRWNNSKLSLAAKSILINSFLLAIPTYYFQFFLFLSLSLKRFPKLLENSFGTKVVMEKASIQFLGVGLPWPKLRGVLLFGTFLLPSILSKLSMFSII